MDVKQLAVMEAPASGRGSSSIKPTHLLRVTWTSENGLPGRSWIETIGQARTYIQSIRRSGGTAIEIEYHYVPRSKQELLAWLTFNDIRPEPERVEQVTEGTGRGGRPRAA